MTIDGIISAFDGEPSCTSAYPTKRTKSETKPCDETQRIIDRQHNFFSGVFLGLGRRSVSYANRYCHTAAVPQVLTYSTHTYSCGLVLLCAAAASPCDNLYSAAIEPKKPRPSWELRGTYFLVRSLVRTMQRHSSCAGLVCSPIRCGSGFCSLPVLTGMLARSGDEMRENIQSKNVYIHNFRGDIFYGRT